MEVSQIRGTFLGVVERGLEHFGVSLFWQTTILGVFITGEVQGFIIWGTDALWCCGWLLNRTT